MREPTVGRYQRFNQILNSLQQHNPHIEASALLIDDGLVVASALPDQYSDIIVAEICSSLARLARSASIELNRGPLKEMVVRAEAGDVLIMHIGTTAILSCLTQADTQLGLVLLDMRNSALAIRPLLNW